jgi:hypothetical protein
MWQYIRICLTSLPLHAMQRVLLRCSCTNCSKLAKVVPAAVTCSAKSNSARKMRRSSQQCQNQRNASPATRFPPHVSRHTFPATRFPPHSLPLSQVLEALGLLLAACMPRTSHHPLSRPCRSRLLTAVEGRILPSAAAPCVRCVLASLRRVCFRALASVARNNCFGRYFVAICGSSSQPVVFQIPSGEATVLDSCLPPSTLPRCFSRCVSSVFIKWSSCGNFIAAGSASNCIALSAPHLLRLFVQTHTITPCMTR